MVESRDTKVHIALADKSGNVTRREEDEDDRDVIAHCNVNAVGARVLKACSVEELEDLLVQAALLRDGQDCVVLCANI